ncbi:MAG: hypothetical protein DMF57_04685 [Acidobacteria bacterium]|nr:MAG: hypothetical protein DMF57_04685 [Acidobacteriota bacterium]
MLALRLTLAIIFTLIGLVGVILPVLQGWPFLILAFLIFFPRHRDAAEDRDARAARGAADAAARRRRLSQITLPGPIPATAARD